MKKLKQYAGMLFMMLIGALCGAVIGGAAAKGLDAGTSFGRLLIHVGILILGMYAAIFVQLILHEAGHLLFGLLTGYSFSSFRIGSWMWLRQAGRIRFKKLTIAGTGGQCLMSPPDFKEGRIPYVWYNLGGSLLNAITALLFGGLYLLMQDTPFVSELLLFLAVCGLAIALMNGLPMRLGAVDNDGYNTLSISRSEAAMRAFWVQLKVSEQTAAGNRLRDMPQAWFSLPDDNAMTNSLIAVIGVLACNRLLDEERLTEADTLAEHLLTIDSGMIGLYRSLLCCDRMYICLVTGGEEATLNALRTKEQLRFMEQMKTTPSVIRTRYAYALLAQQDAQAAESQLAQFEKCAKVYPYPAEIQAERELLEIARRKNAA